MNHNQILRFIMFYERLTKNMIKSISKKANILISLDPKHRLKDLELNHEKNIINTPFTLPE